MNKKINILITCVGGTMMPQLLKEIRRKSKYNLNIIGTDVKKEAIGKYFCDHFETLPNGKESHYSKELLSIVKKYNVDLVIPASDEEALIISKKEKDFKKKNCVVASDNYQNIKILNNKIKTYEVLKKNKINKIFWKKINSIENLEKIIDNYGKRYDSFVIKGAAQRGSREIFFINRRMEIFLFNKKKITFKNFKKQFEETLDLRSFFIMEELQKPVFDIDILTWKGNLLKCVQRKRIHSDFPNKGHIIIENKLVTKLCKDIVKSINLSWLYDCDIMFDKNEKPILLEINPRQSGSLAISVMSGVNLIDDVIDLSLNKVVKKMDHKINNLYVPYQSLIELSND